jgi:micrococcal nuclease
MTDSLFRYRARIDNVVDGDTLDFTIDLGFNITRDIRVRLKDVDTNEIYGSKKGSDEYKAGIMQKDYVVSWIVAASTEHDSHYPLVVQTYKDGTGKYGRYIADVQVRGGDTPSGNADSLTVKGEATSRSLVRALQEKFPEVAS